MVTVTQIELARRIGVSQRAVAYALSDDPQAQKQVRPETRQRILQTAEALGYRPHRHAQLMRGKKSGLLGMISTVHMHQSGVELDFHVSEAIGSAGYNLVANQIMWSAGGVQRAVDVMLDERVEGILLHGLGWGGDSEFPLATFDRIRRAGVPVVVLQGSGRGVFPAVVNDSRQGMLDLTNHVLRCGHRRLAYVTTIEGSESVASNPGHISVQRYLGFRDAVSAAALSDSEVRVFFEPLQPTGWDDHGSGRRAVERILAERERPEAILFHDDHVAAGGLGLLMEKGVRVPGEVAITGFGDTIAGRYLWPALTTTAIASEAMAKKAVEILLKQVRGETISTNEALVKTPCQLVVRQSCGAPLPRRGT